MRAIGLRNRHSCTDEEIERRRREAGEAIREIGTVLVSRTALTEEEFVRAFNMSATTTSGAGGGYAGTAGRPGKPGERSE